MNTLTRQDPIEKLNLSAWAYNALRRVDVKTIGELMDYSQDGLMEIKNMGVKSATEIVNILNGIDIIEFEPAITDNQLLFADDTIAQFIGQDGKLYLDISIVNLGLSVRPFNCLSKAGISYVSELMDKTEADLLTIPRMGRNSVEEIMQAKNRLIFQEIAPTRVIADSKAMPIGSTLCRRIVQEIVQRIQIHAGQLYEALLPLCEAASLVEESVLSVVPITALRDLPILRHAVKATILNALDESPYGLDKSTISSLLPRNLQNDIQIDSVLLELEQDGALLLSSEDFYERRYMTVLEYAGTLKNEKDRIVLTELLHGGKLKQIGKKFASFEDAGKTKQQIGEIKKRCFLKKPRLREDRYALIFQKYDISEDDFIMGFQEDKITYQYLRIAYKHGVEPLDTLVTDPEVPSAFKKAAERILYKNYITLGSERVFCSRPALSEYVLRTAGADGLSFDEFKQLYQMLLEDLNLQDDPKFSVMENKLADSNHVLWKHGKKLRYYNIDSYDFDSLFEQLNLDQFQNAQYSTLKFFREFPDVMQDYDIRDKYELHNLLKKICTQEKFPHIRFKKMPHIEFGTSDRDAQVRELLLTLAPISNTDFALAYEKEYGVESQTVLANYLKPFDLYLHDGIYRIDAPMFPETMALHMKQALSSDFYLLTEIKAIYQQEFPQADAQLLNPYTIKALGFRVYANYAIKDTYPSAVEYFRYLLTSDDIVHAQAFPKALQNTISYTSEVYKLKAAYEIVEYAPLQYINIRRLNAAGIEKSDLLDFCQQVYQTTEQAQYFTIQSLRKSGFTHRLDEFGFDEWFYISLLSEDKHHFSYRRMGKNKIFRKGQADVSLPDFIEWLLYATDSLSLEVADLLDFLHAQYGIRSDAYKIIEAVRGSKMYYDAITEKIYADYDVYFEEI